MLTLAQRKSRRFLRGLTIANAAILVILYLAEVFVAERHWLTTLVTYAPQQLFGVPTALLLLWSLARRSWRIAGVNALAACFFALALLGFSIPDPMRGAGDGPSIRVITYNIHHGFAGVDRIAADVRSIDPDVVCFQESNPGDKRPDPLPRLKAALPGWHCASHGQLAVFSKWPIVDKEVHVPPVDNWRVFLRAEVRVHGRPLNVICLHLNTAAEAESLSIHRGSLSSYLRRASAARSLQVSELLGLARGIRGPLIIAGDFNTPPRGRIYRRMARSFQDSFARAGWGLGYSFKSAMPVMRIDYIWASKDLRPIRCTAPSLNTSDHRPVVADIAFPTP